MRYTEVDMLDKGIVGFSFDDGRADNYTTFKNITIPLNLPVTLNITTGYVDQTCPEDLLPSTKPAVTIDEIRELYSSGLVEIALHGDKHLNSTEDIKNGKLKLCSWLNVPASMKYGFASPGSGLNVESFIYSNDDFFKEDILYLRTGLRLKEFAWLRTMCRKASRLLHIPMLYRIAYKDTLMDSIEDRVLYSIPVMKTITLNEVKSILEYAIDHKKIIIFMFHSILDDVSSEDNWTWSSQKFKDLCLYISEKKESGKVEVKTSREILESFK